MKDLKDYVRGAEGVVRTPEAGNPITVIPFPPMLVRFELTGPEQSIITAHHIKTGAALPEVAEIVEGVLCKDVGPFKIINPDAYNHYHCPAVYKTRIGAYYIYIPDTDANRAIIKVAM